MTIYETDCDGSSPLRTLQMHPNARPFSSTSFATTCNVLTLPGIRTGLGPIELAYEEYLGGHG